MNLVVGMHTESGLYYPPIPNNTTIELFYNPNKFWLLQIITHKNEWPLKINDPHKSLIPKDFLTPKYLKHRKWGHPKILDPQKC